MSRTPLIGVPYKNRIVPLKNYSARTACDLALDGKHFQLAKYLNEKSIEIYGREVYVKSANNNDKNNNNYNNSSNINNDSYDDNIDNERKDREERGRKEIEDEKEREENVINYNTTNRKIGKSREERGNKNENKNVENKEKIKVEDIEKILTKKSKNDFLDEDNLKLSKSDNSCNFTKMNYKNDEEDQNEQKKKDALDDNKESNDDKEIRKIKKFDGGEEDREEVFDNDADNEEYSFALAPQACSAVGYYNIQNNDVEINNDNDNNNDDVNNDNNDSRN